MRKKYVERLVESLKTCANCIVLNDDMEVLPVCDKLNGLKALPPRTAAQCMSESDKKLAELKETAHTGTDVSDPVRLIDVVPIR